VHVSVLVSFAKDMCDVLVLFSKVTFHGVFDLDLHFVLIYAYEWVCLYIQSTHIYYRE
jgi:hypothetical protein